ncbi:MAG: DUF5658 family protein [Mangrovibacterium sp.]
MEILLSIVLIILNILDVMTTNRILAMGGCEANPVVRLLMRFRLFVPAKIAATVFFVWIVLILKPPDSIYLVVCGCAFYLLLVGNNLYQIHKGLKWLREEES